MQTGGGFDLSKLKKKLSEDPEPQIQPSLVAVTPIYDPKRRKASE